MAAVFVYGSLKSTESNSPMMSGATFLFEDTLMGVCDASGDGRFAITDEHANDMVKGEVYEVHPAHLEELDHFEGVAHGVFERRIVELTSGIKAWTYFCISPLWLRHKKNATK